MDPHNLLLLSSLSSSSHEQSSVSSDASTCAMNHEEGLLSGDECDDDDFDDDIDDDFDDDEDDDGYADMIPLSSSTVLLDESSNFST
jgi:hypothetical protein